MSERKGVTGEALRETRERDRGKDRQRTKEREGGDERKRITIDQILFMD